MLSILQAVLSRQLEPRPRISGGSGSSYMYTVPFVECLALHQAVTYVAQPHCPVDDLRKNRRSIYMELCSCSVAL
jgi:hypothetical protein